MKSFMEFLLESNEEDEQLDEKVFAPADFYSKPKDAYFQQLIELIQKEHIVVVGKSDDDPEFPTSEVKVPPAVEEKIVAFAQRVDDITQPTKEDLDEFNKLLAELPYVKTTTKGKPKPITWTTLFKGKFSEQGTKLKGGQASKLLEAATAYCFNKYVSSKKTATESEDGKESINEDEVDKQIEEFLKTKNIAGHKLISAKFSAQKIINTIDQPSSYIAAHVDSNDFEKLNGKIQAIAKIFSGKRGVLAAFKSNIGKNAADNINNDLYPSGANKDIWNKADIVLIKKDLNFESEMQNYLKSRNFESFNTVEQVNEFLNTLIYNGENVKVGYKIIPISLKEIAVTKSTTLNDIMYEPDGSLHKYSTEAKQLERIKNVTIKAAKSVKGDGSPEAGSCFINADSMTITFRHKAEKKVSLIVEIARKGARGGNAVGTFQHEMGLQSRFYDKIYNELFDIKKEDFEDEYIKVLSTLTNHPYRKEDFEIRASAPDWYKRIAFRGIIGFLIVYRQKIMGIENVKDKTPVDLAGMFRYIHGCASGAMSKSIFWLLASSESGAEIEGA